MQGCHTAREQRREGKAAPSRETFICCTFEGHITLFTPVQVCAHVPTQAQLWPCCCRCELFSSSSCPSGGGGDGSSCPKEDARSSPVDAARRKTTGIWARAGLVSCRPWIHLASVAWLWAPAMHMAKMGPSSTVARDRPSVCAVGTGAVPYLSPPSRPKAGALSSFLPLHKIYTLPRLPIPCFTWVIPSGSSGFYKKGLPTPQLRLSGVLLP